MIFLILIFIQLTLSLEIKMSKDSYQPRETLQAEISGNFISLKSENIMIYKENKVHSEPIIQGLTKQDRVYYYYAVLPNQEGNFSLRIENAEYIKSGDIVSDTIIKNFTIKQTNESSQSINPGFIFTKKDFSIKIKALNKDQDISISFENYTYNIFLFEEFEKHKSEIAKKGKTSLPELEEVLSSLKEEIQIIPSGEISLSIKSKAKTLSPHLKDEAYFAIALAFNIIIWSDESKFKKQSEVKVLDTSELIELLNLKI